tara:strand:+ start:56 stop:451 length:396 start_codon:yes stop_codon:yes gene_type:complete
MKTPQIIWVYSTSMAGTSGVAEYPVKLSHRTHLKQFLTVAAVCFYIVYTYQKSSEFIVDITVAVFYFYMFKASKAEFEYQRGFGDWNHNLGVNNTLNVILSYFWRLIMLISGLMIAMILMMLFIQYEVVSR